MKKLIKTTFAILVAATALLSTSCQKPLDEADKPSAVVVSGVNPKANSVSFTVKAEGATAFGYICVAKGETLTAEKIMSDGKTVEAAEGNCTYDDLTASTDYTLLVVSTNGEAFSDVAKVDFTTTAPSETATAEVALKEAAAVSTVTLVLTTEGCESFAYKVVEGSSTEEIIPEVIYAEAEDGDGIFQIDSSASEFTLGGLNGKTTYTVLIAVKAAEGYNEVDKYVTTSIEFTTDGYDQILTVLDIDKFSVKLHVEVDEDTYYRYAITNCDNYWSMITQFFHTDADFLTWGAGIAKGPKTFDWHDGGLFRESDEEDLLSIKPGTAYAVFIGECDKDGNVLYERTDDVTPPDVLAPRRSPDMNLGKYCEESDQDAIKFNGVFAKYYLWTDAPDVAEGKINISIDRMTERSATFTVTPDPSILRYGVSVMNIEDWNYYETWVGKDGMQALMLANSQPFEGVQTLKLEDYMQEGQKYRLIVTGQETKDGSIQASTTVDFEPIVSTLPVPEIVLSPVTDTDGNPYMVWYNIKCTSKNCAYIKYLCNYVPEWVQMLRNGITEEILLATYGVKVSDESILAQINSDAGYNIGFSSWENTESKLVIEACNVEEKGAVYQCISSSLEEPDKEPIETDLKTELLGDWTVSFKTKDNTYSYDVTIADQPEQGPATIDEMDKSTYDNVYYYFYNIAESKKLSEEQCHAYAKEQIESLFQEYKDTAARYAKKYKGQNRLVVRGCGLLEEKSPYQSPWSLFCSTSYSAYNTEELFLDYGSKIFLEFKKDENGDVKLAVETNPAYIPPLLGWFTYDYFWWGSCTENANTYYSDTFDVEVSADKQTLTMKPAMVDGMQFNPSVIMSYGSGIYLTYYASAEDVVFTKKADDAVKAPSFTNRKAEVNFTPGKGHRFMRTRLHDVPEENIPVTTYTGYSIIGNFNRASN